MVPPDARSRGTQDSGRLSSTHGFLGDDDAAQQLILEPLHGDGEVDDGCASGDLGGVGGVGQLGGDEQLEPVHHVRLFVSDLHLVGRSDLVGAKSWLQSSNG